MSIQNDINYSEFLGEEVLVLGEEFLEEGAKIARLIKVEYPDFVHDEEVCLYFEGNEESFYIPKSEIYQFIPKKCLDDENHEYYFVGFRYGKTDKSKEHIYISNDLTVKVGDRVLACGDERAGNVVRTGFYKKVDAPYPVEKTWLIEQKANAWISPNNYFDFAKYVDNDNAYYKYISELAENKNYIAKAKETYRSFHIIYFDDVDRRMIKDENGKIPGNHILDYLDEEWGVPHNRRWADEGTFLMRKNQLYTFFDSVWLSYLLAKNDYIEDGIIDVYKYMLPIYKHGDFDKYLFNVERDKKLLNEHIEFINNFIDFKI